MQETAAGGAHIVATLLFFLQPGMVVGIELLKLSGKLRDFLPELLNRRIERRLHVTFWRNFVDLVLGSYTA
jgi:hypothetical protein